MNERLEKLLEWLKGSPKKVANATDLDRKQCEQLLAAAVSELGIYLDGRNLPAALEECLDRRVQIDLSTWMTNVSPAVLERMGDPSDFFRSLIRIGMRRCTTDLLRSSQA